MVSWKAAVLFSLLLSIATLSHAKHRVTFADLETVKSQYHPALSPDGSMLLYATLGDGIWLVETRAGCTPTKILKEVPSEALYPAWSPDSRLIAYGAHRDGKLQIWVLDIKTKRTRQVTSFPDGMDPIEYSPLVSGISWSPDGHELVFPTQIPTGKMPEESRRPYQVDSRGPDSPLVLTNDTPPNWTLQGVYAHGILSYASTPMVRKTSQLVIIDIRTGKTRQLTNDSAGYFSPAWSPDGKQIACVSTEGRNLEGYQGYPNVYIIDVETGTKKPLTTGLRDRWGPRWSPDGKRIAFSDGQSAGRHDVMMIDLATGVTVDLTEKLGGFGVQYFAWAPDAMSIIANYWVGVISTFVRISLTGEIRPWSNNRDFLDLTSAANGAIAWIRSNGQHAGVIEFLPPGEENPRPVVDLNPQIDDWELGEQEVITWKNARGDEREGVLIKPVGYQPGRKYPLIVECYPHMFNAFYGAPMGANQAQASEGYAIFIANPRPPHVWMFYPEPERDLVKGPKGWDVAVDDVMSGVDELIRLGIADPDRMGLYGFSNGGGVANYLVTRTDRFKCAVSVAGVMPDWILPLFLDLGEGGEATPTFAGGITPWSDPQGYIQLSAIFHLDKVATPILLADGDQDIEFLIGMIEMYNGLRFLGKDVTLLRYPNQEHGFTGVAMKDFWERENAFFDNYLRPQKEITSARAGIRIQD